MSHAKDDQKNLWVNLDEEEAELLDSLIEEISGSEYSSKRCRCQEKRRFLTALVGEALHAFRDALPEIKGKSHPWRACPAHTKLEVVDGKPRRIERLNREQAEEQAIKALLEAADEHLRGDEGHGNPEPRRTQKSKLTDDFFGVPAKKSRIGRCFELAGKFVLFDNSDAVLVHGSVQAGNRPRIRHAWAILPDGSAWEPIIEKTIPQDAFCRFFKPIEDVRYTHKKVAHIGSTTGHWGPWDDNIIEFDPSESRKK